MCVITRMSLIWEIHMLKKNITSLCVVTTLTIVCLVGIIHSTESVPWLGAVCGIFFSMLLGGFVKSLQDVFDTQGWQSSLRKHLRGKLIKSKEFIRISFAYLFRIQVDGEYLLVSSSRIDGKYQPVGGVYKCGEDEKKILVRKRFSASDDNGIAIDESSRNDYRMRVPAKCLRRFVRRFEATNDREGFSNLSREFAEELLKPEILNAKNFSEIKYRVCGRHFSNIEFSHYYQIYELLIADIVEIVLTKEQEAELRELKNKNDSRVMFATEEMIKTCGVKMGTQYQQAKIAEHTYKILTQITQDLSEKDIPTNDFVIPIKL